MSQLAVLVQKDARVIYRDRFLLLMCLYAFLLALLMRNILPLIPVDHLSFYCAPLVISFAPMLLGSVLGFALIEEREQGTWLLLRVLPLPPAMLFGYVAASAWLTSGLTAAAAAALYGLPVAKPGVFLLMLLATCLTAPITMLSLGALASNKVEGLVVAKTINVMAMAPILIFTVPVAWHPLVWWSPFYWIYLGLLDAYATNPAWLGPPVRWPDHPLWLMALVPIVLSLLMSTVLVSVYRRRA